jgi:hypothetical protein
VKRPPKPEPVKRRPPIARRFYFPEPAVPCVYIFITSPVFANVANAPTVAGSRRHSPRRFVSSPSAAPTTSLGSACLASPVCYWFHLELDEPRRLAQALPSNRPGADDDADDDVQYWLRPSGLGSPTCSARKDAYDLTAIFPNNSALSAQTRAVEPSSACNLDVANKINPAAR